MLASGVLFICGGDDHVCCFVCKAINILLRTPKEQNKHNTTCNNKMPSIILKI